MDGKTGGFISGFVVGVIVVLVQELFPSDNTFDLNREAFVISRCCNLKPGGDLSVLPYQVGVPEAGH